MKHIKKFEKDKYYFEIEKEIKEIIKNYNPYVIKYEDNGGYFSVLIKDKNSDFKTWIDIWVEQYDILSEWNQSSYNTNNLNDIIKKGVEDDGDIISMTEGVAISKLLEDSMIYEDDDKYYYHKNFWYIKDGYKKQDVNLDDAKKIKKYNL